MNFTTNSILFFLLLIAPCAVFSQTFTESLDPMGIGSVYGRTISFADVDNDDDLDLMLVGVNDLLDRVAELYINDGHGNFELQEDSPFLGVIGDAAFADVDGDGDNDVLIAGAPALSQRSAILYLNDGQGNFSESVANNFEFSARDRVVFADIDGDNDMDILLNGSSSSGLTATIFKNDGTGLFSEEWMPQLLSAYEVSMVFADVDSDNDQDLFITGNVGENEAVANLFLNDGFGEFTEAENVSFLGSRLGDAAFFDIDGDGDQDLLTTGLVDFEAATQLYINDGTGYFNLAFTPFLDVKNSAIEIIDVDSDDDLDVFIIGTNPIHGPVARLYTSDGFGNYSEVLNLPFQGLDLAAAAFADIDNDGDHDLLTTGANEDFVRVRKLYINGLVSSNSETLEFKKFDLELSPNPVLATSSVNITFNSNKQHGGELKVYNSDGAIQVQRKLNIHSGMNKISVDSHGLVQGIYFAEVISGDRHSFTRFVVL